MKGKASVQRMLLNAINLFFWPQRFLNEMFREEIIKTVTSAFKNRDLIIRQARSACGIFPGIFAGQRLGAKSKGGCVGIQIRGFQKWRLKIS